MTMAERVVEYAQVKGKGIKTAHVVTAQRFTTKREGLRWTLSSFQGGPFFSLTGSPCGLQSSWNVDKDEISEKRNSPQSSIKYSNDD